LSARACFVWYLTLAIDTLVAGTFVIELPATLLILLPFRASRILGAALQAFLQINIIAFGSYNFFNLLTMLLSVSLLDDRVLHRCLGPMALLLGIPKPRPAILLGRGMRPKANIGKVQRPQDAAVAVGSGPCGEGSKHEMRQPPSAGGQEKADG
jgi:Lipase maturation factor